MKKATTVHQPNETSNINHLYAIPFVLASTFSFLASIFLHASLRRVRNHVRYDCETNEKPINRTAQAAKKKYYFFRIGIALIPPPDAAPLPPANAKLLIVSILFAPVLAGAARAFAGAFGGAFGSPTLTVAIFLGASAFAFEVEATGAALRHLHR